MKMHYAGRQGAVPAIVAVLLLFAIISGAITYFMHNSSNPPPSDNSIKKFASYDELEKYLKASSGNYGYYGGEIMSEQMAVKSATTREMAPGAGGSSDYSRTNIQVEGVDEADIVKSDGKYIYAVSGSKITIVDAYPAESAKKVSEIGFKGSVNEIFVNGDKLVIFGQKYEPNPAITPLVKEGASEKMMARPDIYPQYSQKLSVAVYDISDRYQPRDAGEFLIGGNYYNSRMIGNYVYVISSQPAYYSSGNKITIPEIARDGKTITPSFPDIYYFDGVPGNVFTTIAAINLDIMDVTSKIVLANSAQNMYVSEKNIYLTYTKWLTEADYIDKMVDVILPIVPSDIKAKIKAVMATDMSKQIKWQAVGEILNKYTATLSEEERRTLEETGRIKMDELQNQIAKEREKTVVQRIEIGNGNIDYKANGEVPGNTLNQFSMDEHNGYLRVATTTSGNGGVMIARTMAVEEQRTTQAQVAAAEKLEQIPESTGMAISEQPKPSAGVQATTEARVIAPSPPRGGPANNIYVLDSDLKIIGSVEDLAPGERIYSVRFLGERAYMVTFRQMDPLFAIDLSSPRNPVVLGYLKIPGVSDYLHPYDETHVIGVGRDATDQGRMKGLKLSLFDVSDFSSPREISKYIIGEQGTDSDALRDHKAFLFSKEKNLLVIPVRVSEGGNWNAFQGAYVFNVDLNHGITLKGKVSHIKSESFDSTGMRVEGKSGNAVKFSGISGAGDYIKYPKLFSGKHNEITYEAWINPSKYNNETAWIAGQRVHVGGAQLLVNPGKVDWLVAGGSSDVHFGLSSNSEIPVNTWTHIVGTFDGSIMRLYINGKEDAKLDAKFDVLWDGDYRGSFIGKDGSGWFSTFNGKIDDVRIYSRALSPVEISAQYSGTEASSDGLVGWWKFDETGGDTVVDSSGKGNDGRIADYANKVSANYDYSSEIRRSIYIGDALYTLSQKMLMINGLSDLREINRIELPYGGDDDRIMY